MFPITIDDHITLRLLQDEDAPVFFDLTEKNRAYLEQWMPRIAENSSVETSRKVIRAFAGQWENNDGFKAGIFYGTVMAGLIGFKYVDWLNRKTEILYWLSEDHQGKGIVTRCTKKMIEIAFEVFKLNKVEITCAVGNERSAMIPKRLGFTLEGTSRDAEWNHDHFEDHYFFGLLKREWEKAKEGS